MGTPARFRQNPPDCILTSKVGKVGKACSLYYVGRCRCQNAPSPTFQVKLQSGKTSRNCRSAKRKFFDDDTSQSPVCELGTKLLRLPKTCLRLPSLSQCRVRKQALHAGSQSYGNNFSVRQHCLQGCFVRPNPRETRRHGGRSFAFRFHELNDRARDRAQTRICIVRSENPDRARQSPNRARSEARAKRQSP